MNLLVIHRILERQGKSIIWLAKQIGMTDANLYRRVKGNDIKASDLEKIAKVLEVDIRIFFSDNVQKYVQAQNETLNLETENIQLKEKISMLKDLVESQKRTIELLSEELDRKKKSSEN